jgi:hypothetical protein
MSEGPQGERGKAGPPGPPGPPGRTRIVRVRRNSKVLGVMAALAVALGVVLGITVLGSGGAAVTSGSKPASVDERVASAGVYEMTVVIKTDSRSANLRVTIGPIARHVLLSNHRAVVRQQLTVTGRDVPIRASASNASPTITASSRRLASLPTGSPGTKGSTGGTGPANPVAVGVNVAATSGDYFNSSSVRAAIDASQPAWVRVFVGWNAIEPQQGVYNVAEIANYVRFFTALPSATKLDVDVVGTPAWAATGGSTSVSTPPADDADYAGFLRHLVSAFGHRVTAWEIWNEEDSTSWWSGTPAQYVGLLHAAYAAVKSIDPSATVILGGLTGNDSPYLAALYAAGAGGSFDAVGVHTDTACNIASPYDYEYNRGTKTINQYFFLGFTSVHATMVANGDGAKPIYMTELGWSATSAECNVGHWAGQKLAGVTDATQATYLAQAYHCLAQPQYSYVKAAMWFELVDNGTTTGPLDNFGLFDAAMNPKPAFAAFQQESSHGDQLTGRCG